MYKLSAGVGLILGADLAGFASFCWFWRYFGRYKKVTLSYACPEPVEGSVIAREVRPLVGTTAAISISISTANLRLPRRSGLKAFAPRNDEQSGHCQHSPGRASLRG